MSEKVFSDAEIKRLEIGLNFTPTQSNSKNQEMQEHVAAFTRNISLAEYFHECEDEVISLVKNKSNFQPQKYRNQSLEDFAKNLENITKKVKRKIQGVTQSQTAANPRYQEEEKKDKTSMCKTNKQMHEKHIDQRPLSQAS